MIIFNTAAGKNVQVTDGMQDLVKQRTKTPDIVNDLAGVEKKRDEKRQHQQSMHIPKTYMVHLMVNEFYI